MRSRRNNNLIEWAEQVIEEHGSLSLRQIEIRTDISYSTVKGILEGREVGAETIIRFASGFHQDVPKALRVAGYEDIAEVWETGAKPSVTVQESGVSEVTREPFYDDLPPELQQVDYFHGRTMKAVAEMPPGPERDRYVKLLHAQAESNHALIAERLEREAAEKK